MSCWPAWGSTSVQADSGAFSKARRAALQARPDTAVTTHVCAREMGIENWVRVGPGCGSGLLEGYISVRVMGELSQD